MHLLTIDQGEETPSAPQTDFHKSISLQQREELLCFSRFFFYISWGPKDEEAMDDNAPRERLGERFPEEKRSHCRPVGNLFTRETRMGPSASEKKKQTKLPRIKEADAEDSNK